MSIYPARIQPDGSGFMVSFRDIPEALTSGATREEALAMAGEALATAMDFYFEDQRPVPMPTPLRRGETGVALPASLFAKILLLNTMLEQQVTPSALARRLQTTPQTVNRIVDLRHATKIDTIDLALGALGKRLELRVG